MTIILTAGAGTFKWMDFSSTPRRRQIQLASRRSGAAARAYTRMVSHRSSEAANQTSAPVDDPIAAFKGRYTAFADEHELAWSFSESQSFSPNLARMAASLLPGSTSFETDDEDEPSAKVPFVSTLPRGSFFVRECYRDCYKEMTLLFGLRRICGITIAGTSGVGTSVFMAYFFLRYQLEHPSTTFVFIFFNNKSVAQRIVEWKNGESKELAMDGLIDFEKKYLKDVDAIFLLDGPPRGIPVVLHRYVLFTSYSKTWLEQINEDTHRVLYMPLWDVEELKDAVRVLDLEGKLGRLSKIPSFPRGADAEHRYEDEVVYRFDVFGGIPRSCLETDASRLAIQLQELQTAAATVDVETGEVSVLGEDGKDSEKELSQRLYHWHPTFSEYFCQLKIASSYVKQLLSARVDGLDVEDRARLESSTRWCPVAAALRQAMLKTRFLTLVEQGVHMVANVLGYPDESQEFDLNLSIKPSGPVVRLFTSYFGHEDPLTGSWFVPPSNAFKTIDAIYFINACVGRYGEDDVGEEIEIQNGKVSGHWESNFDAVLFHVMVDMDVDHVDGKALHELLMQDECMRSYRHRVALVYVVPAARAEYLTWQIIDGGIRLNDSFPLTAVKGISAEKYEVLKTANIHTVGDLHRQSTTETLTPEQLRVYNDARARLKKHENDAVVTGSDAYGQLQAIPQFVWGV